MKKTRIYLSLILCFLFGTGITVHTSTLDENEPDKYIFGTLQNTSAHLASNYNAGMRMAILALGWNSFYSSEGTKNTSYINNQKSLLQSYRDMGYQVMLDFGIQYPPAWIYDYANSRVKNQYGDEFSGGIGETAVNAVFNDLMRQKQEQYIEDVFDTFGKDFEIVRLGFMRYGELGYIQPNYNSKTNCYWAFDDIAQGNTSGAGLPGGISVCPVPGWIPGTSSINNENAALFIDWYINALKNYHDWQITTVRKYFDNEMAMLYPSWGLRNGQIEAAIQTDLNGTSGAEGTMEVQRAHDFKRFIEGITDSKVIVYGTWIDSNPEWSSPTNPCPIEFLADLAKNHSPNLKVMGENTGGGGITEMRLTFERMESNGLAGIMWAFESDLYDGAAPTLTNYALYIAEYLGLEPPAKRVPIVKPLWITDKDTETDWGGLYAPDEEKYIMSPIEGFEDAYKCTLFLNKYFKNNKWDTKWGNQPAPDGEAQNEGWSDLYQFVVVYQDEYGSDRTNNNPYAVERSSFTIDTGTTVTFYAVVQTDGNIRSYCDAQTLSFSLFENLTGSVILPPAIGKNSTNGAVDIITNGTNKKIESTTSKNFINPNGVPANNKFAIYSRGRHAFTADFASLTYLINKVPDLLQNPKMTIGTGNAVDAPEATMNIGTYSVNNPLLFKGSIEGASATDSPFNVESVEAVLLYEIIAESETSNKNELISMTAANTGSQTLTTWNSDFLNLSENLPNGNYTLSFSYKTVSFGDTLAYNNEDRNYTVSFSVSNPITALNTIQVPVKITTENNTLKVNLDGTATIKLYSVSGQLIDYGIINQHYIYSNISKGIYILSINNSMYKILIK